jgi:chemotaxis response regulator CheB
MWRRRLTHTRILTVDLPRLLSGVLSAILAEHQDIEVIREVNCFELAVVIQKCDANVVLIGTQVGQADGMVKLLSEKVLALRIVTIDQEGRKATMYESGIATCEVGEVSAEVLVHLLRGTPL